MFILGICIHLIFLFSIFDIYFKSPVVKDVTPYRPNHEALADRLVLFVVDGLRAESFLNYTTMPYLRSKANSIGRWGISNTRVPTESRPGHVAVIAGFYEDPSAVAKGWKENPVDFDSVFNRTMYTWCWGTYDIVEIFTKGTNGDHIFIEKMDPYDQTFSTDKNTTLLDAWVFDHVEKFFQEAKNNNEVIEKLYNKKTAFFLHLLGTDTSGHTHKPKTKNFLNTIEFVDRGIKEMVDLIEDFYKHDGKTTYLMTSDHGMTDWGSHGAGDDHETQTPYVIWGAGVQQRKHETFDPLTYQMSAEHRLDLNQADLTPLMTTILSIPVPVNSIGQLTPDLLNMDLPNKAKAIYSNSRQLAHQYNKKRQDVEANAIKILYYPFEPFTKEKYDEIIEFTEKLLREGDYEKLILFSEEIMQLSLNGLNYYHNYYQKPLLILVTLSFIGWIMNLLKILAEQSINTQAKLFSLHWNNAVKTQKTVYNLSVNISCTILCLVGGYIVYEQNLPFQYYLYFTMPVFLWWNALSSFNLWLRIFGQAKNNAMYKMWIEVFCYTVGSITMGLSFTNRWMLSIPLLGMGLWPLFTSTKYKLSIHLLIAWTLGCFLLSAFSFMPVIGKDVFIGLVILAGLIWLLVITIYLWKVLLPLYWDADESRREIEMTVIQMLILLISLHDIYTQSKRFENGTPVSEFYQTLTWIITVISLVYPLICSRRLVCRLSSINTSLLNFYLLLSVSHEGLFMVTLIINVTCWMLIEFRLVHDSEHIELTDFIFENEDNEKAQSGFTLVERSISNQDFRRAFFFTLYIVLAFFGTGNIASLNSFEVRWVTCFITSFQPFIITGLILLKTLAPFLTVACTFRAVQHLTKAPSGYLNIIVLIYSNIMGLQLLYYVKNTGSWLEIGTSISQFVIVQVITLFIVLINQLAKLMTDISIRSLANKVFKGQKKYV